MDLKIRIKDGMIGVALEEKGKKIDEVSFPDEHNLGRKLLPMIEKLLRRNKLASSDVEKTALESDISDNLTTRRIAEAVVNAFNWNLDEEDLRAGNLT